MSQTLKKKTKQRKIPVKKGYHLGIKFVPPWENPNFKPGPSGYFEKNKPKTNYTNPSNRLRPKSKK